MAASPHPAHDVLRELLVAAGRRALQLQKHAQAEIKPDGSPVTAVDRELDEALAAGLMSAFPGVGVCGEEGARATGTNGCFWIDPIDGTGSYLQGLAYWGPTVCLVENGELSLGALYLPMLDQFWFAARGAGAWRDGERLPHLTEPEADDERILFAPSRMHVAPRGLWSGRLRVFGSTAAHLALVAGGAGAATLVPRWKLWDVGCGALLVTETGGVLSDLDGSPVDLVNGPPALPFIAGAPTALHDIVAAARDWRGSNDARS